MSRPSGREQSSVSLFPFLAVLVCAMGALILLLVVTTRRIRLQAIARAYQAHIAEMAESRSGPRAAENPPRDRGSTTAPNDVTYHEPRGRPTDRPIDVPVHSQSAATAVSNAVADPDAESGRLKKERQDQERFERKVAQLRAQWESEIEKLAAERDRWREKQRTAREKAKAAQAELKRLQAKLQDRESELAMVEQTAREDHKLAAELQEEAERLRRLIEELQRKIAEARRQLEAARSQFAFIPYEGRSGTTRRPILIECRGDTITFLPEQVSVTRTQLDGFTVKYNPLLAGAKALVAYWTAWNRVHPTEGMAEEPYVLLLVRPSGSFMYYVAREILSELDVPYGYELIDSDWELALPDPDPQAVAECRRAVEKVLSERERLLAFLAENRPLAAGQLKLDEPIGGRRDGRVTGGRASGPRRRAESPDESHSGPARAGQPRSSRPHSPQAPSAQPPLGDSRSGNRRPTKTISRGGRAAGGPRTAEATPGVGTDGTSLGVPGDRLDNLSSNGNFSSPRSLGRTQHVLREPRRLPTEPVMEPLPPGGSRRGTAGSAPSFLSRETPMRSNGELGRSPSAAGPFADRLRADGEASDQRTAGTQDANSLAEHLGGAPVAGRATLSSSRRGSSSERIQAEQTLASSNRLEGRAPQKGDPFTNGSDELAGQALPSPSSAAAAIGRASRSGQTGLRAGRPAGAAGLAGWPLPAEPRLPESPNWLPPRAGGTIGMEREVTIRVGADRLQVDGRYLVRTDDLPTTEQLMARLYRAYRAALARWGRPPRRFYWVPVIRFVVYPGGLANYERVNTWLKKRGLRTTAQFELYNTAPRDFRTENWYDTARP